MNQHGDDAVRRALVLAAAPLRSEAGFGDAVVGIELACVAGAPDDAACHKYIDA